MARSAADWVEADDDEAAIARMKDGYKCEVWQGPRVVTRIDLRRQA